MSVDIVTVGFCPLARRRGALPRVRREDDSRSHRGLRLPFMSRCDMIDLSATSPSKGPIMAFIHRFEFLGTEGCGRRHDVAADARACEEATVADFQTNEWEKAVGVCPHCDGLGHGTASCPLVNHFGGPIDELDEARGYSHLPPLELVF